jgi:hypothetical protein
MEKHLAELSNSTTKLFDGLEENLFGQKFEVLAVSRGRTLVNPSMLDKNKFKSLAPLIGEKAVNMIVESKHFKYEGGLFPGYVGTDNLDLYYLLVENTLLIFSLGEYQPARYIFYFEGAWQVSSF